MAQDIEAAVREQYGSIATRGRSSRQDGVRRVAEAFGYSEEELASIPAEANMGLSCGNPTAFASLREGETVVDLGSGGGLDVFLAARVVGPSGKAIGIDMTQEMIDLARRNAATANDGRPLENVEFHRSTIDKMPLAEGSVDCIISNCVINLASDKRAVFRDMARVLKPGGRVAISDIALKQALPEEVAGNLLAHVGCIAGAISFDDYRDGLTAAGFSDVEIVETGADLSVYADAEAATSCCSATDQAAADELAVVESSCCSAEPDVAAESSMSERLRELMRKYNVNDFAASIRIYAVKAQ